MRTSNPNVATGETARRSPWERALGALVAALGFLWIASLTLLPSDGAPYTPSLCIICGDYGGLDFLLNIALFVPFGIGLGLMGLRPWRAMLLVFVTTFVIEALQIRIVGGRDASIGDLLSNTLGGTLGIALGSAWRSLLTPSAIAARRLVIGAAVTWIVIMALGAVLVRPSLTSTPYWGEWEPGLRPEDTFQGTVLRATWGGRHLVNDPLGEPMHDGPEFARGLLRGERVDAWIIPGPSTAERVPLVRVVDTAEEEEIILLQHGRDLFFQIRTAARDAKLRSPALRLTDVLPERANLDTLHISGELADHRFVVRVEGPRQNTTGVLSLRPTLAWSTIVPFEFAIIPKFASLLDGLWAAALFLPIAFWSAWASPRRAFAGALAVTALVGFVAVPRVFQAASPGLVEWAMLACATLIGWSIGTWSHHVHARRGPRR